MKKKVMKQVIKRQREQIENLTKALAAMTTIARGRNTPSEFAKSVKTADMGIGGRNGAKAFDFQPIAPVPDHSTILGGASKLHVTITKDRSNENVLKDIDDPSMYPSRMKSFDLKPSERARNVVNSFKITETFSGVTTPPQPDSFVKKIYPKMSNTPSGDHDKDNALLRLEDDDYVYMEDWSDLLADMQEVGLPVDDDASFAELSTTLSTMSPVSKLVLARATMDKGNALDATIWIIEALRFMDRECSDDNRRADHDITINPVHDMLLTAFKTASHDTIEIMRKALEEYDNMTEEED